MPAALAKSIIGDEALAFSPELSHLIYVKVNFIVQNKPLKAGVGLLYILCKPKSNRDATLEENSLDVKQRLPTCNLNFCAEENVQQPDRKI